MKPLRTYTKIWEQIKRLFWRLTLAEECPHCHQVALRWHGDNPIHFDGPPILEWWECSHCKVRTETRPTQLVERTVQRMGYKNAEEWVQKHLEKLGTEK